jgi:hypothetical protein
MKERVAKLYGQQLITLDPYVIAFYTRRTIQSVDGFFIIANDDS